MTAAAAASVWHGGEGGAAGLGGTVAAMVAVGVVGPLALEAAEPRARVVTPSLQELMIVCA
jgi:hypothetical protein